MKNFFVMILLMLAVFVSPLIQETQAQSKPYRIYTLDYGTLSNSVLVANETQYIDLAGWEKIDSISIVAYGIGELDVDSVDIYVGSKPNNGKSPIFSSTAITATVTLNLADGVSGWERLVTSNATKLTGAALRGVQMLKVNTRGATSGNDPTDASQRFYLAFQVWGTMTP